MDVSSAYSYFLDVIIPRGVNKYQTEDASELSIPTTPESGEPLIIDTIIRCIKDYKIAIPKVKI